MSRDLNKVLIIGRLGADPELRFTAQGSAVAQMRVASGRQWKSADGEQQDATEWFRVVAWNKLAEVCNSYLTKGSRVYFEGRLQTRKWQDQDGNDRYSTEVIASDMIMLDSKRATEVTDDDAPNGDEEYQTPAAPAPKASGSATKPDAKPAAPVKRNVPRAIVDDDADLPF